MDIVAAPPPRTQGVHHVGLSVSDLDASTVFFLDVLGFRKIGQRPEYPAAMVSDGHTMFTLWQVEDPDGCVLFDRRKNVGLHHVALLVPDVAALDALHDHLVQHDVAVEFAPQARADAMARHMMCYIPGGPRMEFIVLTPPAATEP